MFPLLWLRFHAFRLTRNYRIYSRNSRHRVIHAFNTIFKKVPV